MITDITLSRGKAFVYIDGIRTFILRTKDIKNAGLKVGMEIDYEDIINKVIPVQRADCYESALCILDISSQTRTSLNRKLRSKGYLDEVCGETILKLVDIGLIDEKRYTERIVECEKKKAVSTNSVRRKLISKGIDHDMIETFLESMDEMQQSEACKKAAVPLLRRYRDNEPRIMRQKIAQALARKGFSWDVSSTVIEELLQQDQ